MKISIFSLTPLIESRSHVEANRTGEMARLDMSPMRGVYVFEFYVDHININFYRAARSWGAVGVAAYVVCNNVKPAAASQLLVQDQEASKHTTSGPDHNCLHNLFFEKKLFPEYMFVRVQEIQLLRVRRDLGAALWSSFVASRMWLWMWCVRVDG